LTKDNQCNETPHYLYTDNFRGWILVEYANAVHNKMSQQEFSDRVFEHIQEQLMTLQKESLE
jgi:hypothetical protein